jgi:fused signal recognition particle receptor
MNASDRESEQRDARTAERSNGWLRRAWRANGLRNDHRGNDVGDDRPDIEPAAPPETPPGEVPELVPQPEEPTPASPIEPGTTPPHEPEIVPEREPGQPAPGTPDVPPDRPPELPPYPDRTPTEPGHPPEIQPGHPPEIQPGQPPEIEPGGPVEIPPPTAMAPDAADASLTEAARSARWVARLRQGLSRSSAKLGGGITDLFQKRRLDDETLEELEELLISADIGVTTAMKLTAALAGTRFNQDVSPEEVKSALAEEMAKVLAPVAQTIAIHQAHKPHVILVCGVNGSGKTTTIAKLGGLFTRVGLKVMLAAGDTFRAAAVEQLQIWGERIGAPVIAKPLGADAAGLAYDALQQARARRADILIIDTAGRLQNRADLMGELQKIVRVLKKIDSTVPHDTILVLDAGVGQNAHSQVETFREMVNVTGLVMTKLDGSAKGGVVVALADKHGLPVHAVGVGEGLDDMRPFDPSAFARSLMGLNPLKGP